MCFYLGYLLLESIFELLIASIRKHQNFLYTHINLLKLQFENPCISAIILGLLKTKTSFIAWSCILSNNLNYLLDSCEKGGGEGLNIYEDIEQDEKKIAQWVVDQRSFIVLLEHDIVEGHAVQAFLLFSYTSA